MTSAASRIDWEGNFEKFSRAFADACLPVSHLIGFIDGKLWPVARPSKFQKVLYW